MLLHQMLTKTLVMLCAGVIPFAAWGAIPAETSVVVDPLKHEDQPRDWSWIVLHHSATPGGSVASSDAAHRRNKDSAGKPWLGIGYHFVVGNGRGMPDGEVQATFRWQRQLAGAHAGRDAQNQQGIGICLVGDFEHAPPSERQLSSLKTLLKALTAQYDIPSTHIVRHQDINATLCPGRSFPWNQLIADLGAADTTHEAPARDKGS